MNLIALLVWAAGTGIAVLVLYLRDPYARGPGRNSGAEQQAPPPSQNDAPASRWSSTINMLSICRRSL
jgi:hypothetical protein